MESDKKKWELSHLQALKQAEDQKAEEEDEVLLTFNQEDVQDKVKRKRKRKRSFSDDDSAILGSNSLNESALEACFDGHVDESTPARRPPRRSKRTVYLDDYEYPGEDAFEDSLEGRRTRSRASRRRQVSNVAKGQEARTAPKSNTTTVTKNSSQPSSSRKSPSVIHNASIAGELPSELAGGMVMTPVMMQPAGPNQSALPVTTIPLNYPVAPAGVRPVATGPVSTSSVYSASGGPYMLVTVGPDGQSITKKVVKLPPNVVFRVVPVSVGSGNPTNQASQ